MANAGMTSPLPGCLGRPHTSPSRDALPRDESGGWTTLRVKSSCEQNENPVHNSKNPVTCVFSQSGCSASLCYLLYRNFIRVLCE